VQENKVVFTEMEEFVWSLQLDEDTHKPVIEDVFKEDDEGPGPVKQDDVTEAIGGWTEVKEMDIDISDLRAMERHNVPAVTRLLYNYLPQISMKITWSTGWFLLKIC
jgi:U4/U6.U5 tri-snRNP-associated protein 1